jgi:hypothetical protein
MFRNKSCKVRNLKYLIYIFVLLFSIFFMTTCLINSTQYRDDDEKDLSCESDMDCSLERYCKESFCEIAPGCLSCKDLPQANPICFHGECLIQNCENGWHDANAILEDGCEYQCEISNEGVEICDYIDNDCDGRSDEDFNLSSDPFNCGDCHVVCESPDNADSLCVGGDCIFVCQPGYYDVDGNPDNGCESQTCEESNGGVEICNLKDNDCDGQVDEDIVKVTPESCGPLCEKCEFDNAEALCVEGNCNMADCQENCQDLNQDPADGCEYCCEITNGGEEVCDDLDNDCDGLVDEGLTCDCPEGMVLIESSYCIDKYEASRFDASMTSMGNDIQSGAQSVPDVMPWSAVSLTDASNACQAVGKRLCSSLEWETACKGAAADTVYSYGNTYDATACNGIDAFCYCHEGSACESEDTCPFPHCYQSCGASFHIAPTRAFPNCKNPQGVFDINGNVWERVQGGVGRGGAFNCGDSELLHRCDYVANWGSQAISNFGFRCCCSGSGCPSSK